MRIASLALLALTACGRLGFAPEERSGIVEEVPPGPVSVTVRAAGQPIADAYVVVVAADGTTELLRTDATGTATTMVEGATTFHVAFPLPSGGQDVAVSDDWEVRSFHRIGGGTDLHVGSFHEDIPGTTKVTVPVDAGATQYRIAGPLRCNASGTGAMPAIDLTYDPRCEGETVAVLAVSDDHWLDAGTVPLQDGGTANPAGVWMPTVNRSVRLAFPTSVEGMAMAALYDVRGADDLEIGMNEVMTSGGEVVVPVPSAPLPVDRVQVFAVTGISNPFPTAVTGHLAYVDAGPEIGGELVIDERQLPPAIEFMAYAPSTHTVLWGTAAPPQAHAVVTTLVAFATPAGGVVQWMSYAPGDVTELVLPALPAPLEMLTPTGDLQEMSGVLVTQVDAWTQRELMSRIDTDVNPFTSVGPGEVLPSTLAISIRLHPNVQARAQPGRFAVRVPRAPVATSAVD